MPATTMSSWQRPSHWPSHWVWVELPEDNGDPRLLEACWALMDVRAYPPALDMWREERADYPEIPVLDGDPDFNDLPIDHTQGTQNDCITQVAVVRLAKAVLAVADRHQAQEMDALRAENAKLRRDGAELMRLWPNREAPQRRSAGDKM